MRSAHTRHSYLPRIRGRVASGEVGLAVAFGCCLLSSTGGAEAQPAGTPFRVNTVTTGYQMGPAIASAADGSFVVVWTNVIGRTGSLNGQRFYRGGAPAGTEFRVDSVSGIAAGGAAIASDPAGNFFVAFTDYQNSEGIYRDDVYVRRFAKSGEPLGPELRVNTYATEAQNQPSIAADAHGRFVVAWKRFDHYGAGGLFGQRFSETGDPAGEEFAIKVFTPTQIDAPSIACSADGSFVIVWNWVASQTTYLYDVDASIRRYDASGAPLGPEFRVNTYTTGAQAAWGVASDATGNFTIVWQDKEASRPGTKIVARRFSSGGEPLGPEFRVNTHTQIEESYLVSISSSAQGDFVIAWFAFSYSPMLVHVQPFARTGEPRGSEMTILVELTPWPVVASDLDGDFVVAYESGGYPYHKMEVFAQRYVGGLHGDVDGDGLLGAGDVLALINYLFAAGPAPLGPADANSDGAINVIDILFLINNLFAGGPPPP